MVVESPINPLTSGGATYTCRVHPRVAIRHPSLHTSPQQQRHSSPDAMAPHQRRATSAAAAAAAAFLTAAAVLLAATPAAADGPGSAQPSPKRLAFLAEQKAAILANFAKEVLPLLFECTWLLPHALLPMQANACHGGRWRKCIPQTLQTVTL
jgi:hypothetical protein